MGSVFVFAAFTIVCERVCVCVSLCCFVAGIFRERGGM